MASFEAKDVAEIKSRLSLEDIAGRYVQLRPVGERLMAPCPFHQETKASFSISPDRGFYYCFGCQAKGDVIEFYRNINGLDFSEAVTQLAAEAGVTLERTGSKSSPQAEKSRSAVCREINSWSQSFFRDLLNSPGGEPARKYLKQRGISPEISQTFSLGWSPEGWNNLKEFLQGKGFAPQDGVTAGVLSSNRQGRIFDRFRGRLIFPITALSGAVVAFGGRVIADGEPKYLNSSESPVYTKGEHLYGLYQARQSITRSKQVFLTEGYLDVLALHQHGFTNSCGILGTALTKAQVKRLSGLAREVVLLFDGDDAGQNAALKSAEMILQAGMNCRVLTFPPEEDAHSILNARGKQGLNQLLEDTREGLDFCLNMLITHKSLRELMSWVEQFVSAIQDFSWRSYYIPRIAQALGLSEKELREKFTQKTAPESQNSIIAPAGKGPEQRDRELLSFAVCFPEYRSRLKQKNLGLVLSSEWARRFWEKLRAMQEEELEILNPEEAEFFVQSKMRLDFLQKDKERILEQVEEFVDKSMARISKKNLKLALARAQQNQDQEEIKRILGLLQKSF